jgi:hypothetical protein
MRHHTDRWLAYLLGGRLAFRLALAITSGGRTHWVASALTALLLALLLVASDRLP